MIHRRTDHISHDAEEVLNDKLKNKSFSIQINESTYFINKSYVFTFIRFVSGVEIEKNFFVAKSCLKRATGKM
jgi:hypothetical protein